MYTWSSGHKIFAMNDSNDFDLESKFDIEFDGGS